MSPSPVRARVSSWWEIVPAEQRSPAIPRKGCAWCRSGTRSIDSLRKSNSRTREHSMSSTELRAVASAGAPAAMIRRIVAWAAATLAGGIVAVRYPGIPELLVAVAFLAVLAVLSVIDLEQRRVPNRIVLPAAAVALAAIAVLEPGNLVEAAAAGVVAFLFFLIPALVMPRAVGMGDAKLALLIGFVLGWDILPAFFVMSIAGGVAGLVMILSGRRGSYLPFVPFLAVGAAYGLVAAGGALYS